MTGFILLAASGASAAECGDDVAGVRVACSCGDVVVSATTLQPDDPVVSERCDYNGLVLRAGRGAATIVLNLSGLSIVGSGSGVGIRIMNGGDEGAVVIGGEIAKPGEIANFRNGVRATGSHSLAEIRDVVIKGSTGDGLVVRGADARVIRVTADGSGRDGLRVSGRDHRLQDIEATGNGRYGVRVIGRDVEGRATASGNVRGALAGPPAGTDIHIDSARGVRE